MTGDHSVTSSFVPLEAARSAPKSAFGPATIEEIIPVGGGASGAFPFRAVIGGRRYLVRVEGTASPLRNPHQYESMRVAAQSEIAPRVYYVDETRRVAVTDFIEERPLSLFPGGSHSLARAIGELLSRLQATQPFPRFVEYPDIVGRLWAWVCGTGLFAPGVLDPCTERFEQIRSAYVWDSSDSVASHNDLVARNVLFDGKRLWLIDWESAYRNDPLVDVAIALDSFARVAELEQSLLRAWLGRSPNDFLMGRLVQVRALTRFYYAGVFLSSSAAAAGPLGDHDLSAPTVPEFRRAIREGRFKTGAAATKHVLGKMYLASFLTGTIAPGLSAAA